MKSSYKVNSGGKLAQYILGKLPVTLRARADSSSLRWGTCPSSWACLSVFTGAAWLHISRPSSICPVLISIRYFQGVTWVFLSFSPISHPSAGPVIPILKYISLTQNMPDSIWILCLPITAVGQATVTSYRDQCSSLPTAGLCLLPLYLSLLALTYSLRQKVEWWLPGLGIREK